MTLTKKEKKIITTSLKYFKDMLKFKEEHETGTPSIMDKEIDDIIKKIEKNENSKTIY